MVHPKDSIHIVFDAGKMSYLEELAKTIHFSGNATEDNVKMIAFRDQLYKASIPGERYTQYEKEKNPDEFIGIIDSLRNVRMEMANKFIQQGVSKELEEWIRNDVEFDYYNSLAYYPNSHAQSNNLDRETIVPIAFYNFMDIQLSPDKLYNSQLSSFIGSYRFARIGTLMVKNGSLVKDGEKMITLPFLREPLINKYVETKRHVENPQLEGNLLLKSAKDTPADQLIRKIVKDHQGKIIFLDIWATWCSPCWQEMPYSKELMHSLNSDQVAFVYLCTDSEEDQWKALISELRSC